MTALEQLVSEVTSQGRVCPMPTVWNQLWEQLPDRRRVGAGWEPPAPLILAAWHYCSDQAKRERFHLHLRWASDRGALDAVARLISNMKPEDWHTER